MLLGELAAGHGDRQLDVVGRVGGDEVDAFRLDLRQERQRVAEAHLQARRIEMPLSAGIGRTDVREQRTQTVSLRRQDPEQFLERVDPALLDLEAYRPPGPSSDGCSQERSTDAGERVENELSRLREELDQPSHQPWRLVCPVPLAERVPQFGGIGSSPD
jgi:hypothetical protein